MNVAETQDIYITPSEIIEYLYCPRFIYFMNCLAIPQHEELRYKVLKGRRIHEERIRLNPDYLRKRLNCIAKDIDVYMASDVCHIKGKVDEVLFLDDGTLSPLDYKYAEYKEYLYRTHKYQSVLYAMLIKETYRKEAKKGFICYVRSASKVVEVAYKDKDFLETKEIITNVLQIMQTGYFPKKTSHRARCIDCCYRNICV